MHNLRGTGRNNQDLLLMLSDRVIFVEINDRDGNPIAGSTVSVFVDGNYLSEIKTDAGRATLQISQTSAVISIQATFGEFSERTDVGPDVERWIFTLPVTIEKHLVILVHGINTRAHWMNQVGKALSKAGLVCEPAGYGYYGVLRFLLPLDWLRQSAIRRVVTKIDAAIDQHEPDRISIISHSFGSYVIARIIQSEFRLKWHRVILCGSVVPATFPFEHLKGRFTAPILNEVGTRDFWPALAESLTWGYGSIGSHGFQGAPLTERWYRGFSHSDFLTAQHCKDAWLPFLMRGEVVDADEPEALPLVIRLLTLLPIKWLTVAILIFFIGFTLVERETWSSLWLNLPGILSDTADATDSSVPVPGDKEADRGCIDSSGNEQTGMPGKRAWIFVGVWNNNTNSFSGKSFVQERKPIEGSMVKLTSTLRTRIVGYAANGTAYADESPFMLKSKTRREIEYTCRTLPAGTILYVVKVDKRGPDFEAQNLWLQVSENVSDANAQLEVLPPILPPSR